MRWAKITTAELKEFKLSHRDHGLPACLAALAFEFNPWGLTGVIEAYDEEGQPMDFEWESLPCTLLLENIAWVKWRAGKHDPYPNID